MKICLAGEGAQGFSHYESLADTHGVEIVTLCGGLADDAQKFAEERGEPELIHPATFKPRRSFLGWF